nr:hypothetical protein [Nocardia farcinica]
MWGQAETASVQVSTPSRGCSSSTRSRLPTCTSWPSSPALPTTGGSRAPAGAVPARRARRGDTGDRARPARRRPRLHPHRARPVRRSSLLRGASPPGHPALHPADVLHPRPAPQLAELARIHVAYLRLTAGRYPTDAQLANLIELSMRSNHFATLWATSELADRTTGDMHMRHPTVGVLHVATRSGSSRTAPITGSRCTPRRQRFRGRPAAPHPAGDARHSARVRHSPKRSSASDSSAAVPLSTEHPGPEQRANSATSNGGFGHRDRDRARGRSRGGVSVVVPSV